MSEKAIFVDWDGTLSGSRFWQAWRDDAAELHKYRAIEQMVFGRDKRMMNGWMLGKLSAEQVVESVASKTGLLSVELMGELKASCEKMEVLPGIVAAIQESRAAGHRVFVATDNMDTFSRWTRPALKLDEVFDGILNSADIGFFKRDIDPYGRSLFFESSFRQFSIDPANAILIDDSANSQIVERFGMSLRKVSSPAETAAAIEGIM